MSSSSSDREVKVGKKKKAAEQVEQKEEEVQLSHYKKYEGSHRKYQNSAKGKEARKRYQDSPKGKAARKRAQMNRRERIKEALRLLEEQNS